MAQNCSHDCTLCLHKLCMKRIPVFSDLKKDDLEQLAKQIIHEQHPKGTLILRSEEKADNLIIINSGEAKAYRYTFDGKEQILYLFSEGDFFGEQGLFNDAHSDYSVEALTPVNICRLYRSDFQDLLKKHPEIALQLITALSQRLAGLEQLISLQDIDARIQAFLIELVAKYGGKHKDGYLVRLPLSREGMANYLGIARETVSRKLKQLESDGSIKLIGTKHILIPNIENLKPVI